MVKNNEAKIVILLAAIASTRTVAFPQPADVDKVTTSGYHDNTADTVIDLPFLQIKNGGIRVNFAGFHAEAGLGGRLGGSNAGGGLYASAGTPWGPSASAGLGGSLGGVDGTARGGIHARAGLGNGRPDAVAGLGGSLDGSGRFGNRGRGGLYAGVTRFGPPVVGPIVPINQPGPSVPNDQSGEKPGSSNTTETDDDKTKGSVKEVSNIQSIAPSSGKAGEKVYLSKSGVKDPVTTLEFKPPAIKERKPVSTSLIPYGFENLNPKYDLGGSNAVVDGIPFAPNPDDISQILYPSRRYYRKLLRGGPVRKPSFYKYLTANTGAIDDIPAESAVSNHAGGIVTRQAIDDHSNGHIDSSYGKIARPKGTALFNDIFNIPISTLAAVNQLLNNNSG